MLAYNNNYAFEPFGIQNTGNSCYFNSFIQCIMSLTSIFETVSDETNSNKTIQFLKDLKQDSDKQKTAMAMHQYLLKNNKKGLQNGVQEDVNEIFMCFIDVIPKSLLR